MNQCPCFHMQWSPCTCVCVLLLSLFMSDPIVLCTCRELPALSRVTLGAHAQQGLCLSVCLLYTTFSATARQGGQSIPTGLALHCWLDFKCGDFRKNTAFKSYGVTIIMARAHRRRLSRTYESRIIYKRDKTGGVCMSQRTVRKEPPEPEN